MASLNRRTFLAAAGSGAAALAIGKPARASGPNEAIRVAVIGFNGRGKSHIEAFNADKRTTIATLCDVDTRLFDRAAATVEASSKRRPECVQDLRRVLDDKAIDVVSIATPNHWHALATVWACQAGKDVYVEKPVSQNFLEGTRMVEAARKYGRVVQAGTQNRSFAGVIEAVARLRAGLIGEVYLAKGLCYKPRKSIGRKADAPVPAGVDYNLWLGAAPERPFNPNRFHYEWHWNWDYGNGDLGNQGIHQMDVARWGLGKEAAWPTRVESSGGRFTYKDDGETPNTQLTTYRYDDSELIFEVRGLATNDEQGVKIGNIFYGSKGLMTINGTKWATHLGPAGGRLDPGPSGGGGGSEATHFANFVEAVIARDPAKLHAPIVEGHRSSALCHLGNVAFRTGRALAFDPSTETFPSDPAATALLTREYRSPFAMPAAV